MYRIVVCHNCGRLLLTKTTQQTRQCPHCGARINTKGAKVVGSAASAQEASKLIRELKQKRQG